MPDMAAWGDALRRGGLAGVLDPRRMRWRRERAERNASCTAEEPSCARRERRPFRAELRVSGIGRCQSNGPRTYMALKVRVALQPGQRPSWYQANGSHGLCSYP
jgi:hypothetical protein